MLTASVLMVGVPWAMAFVEEQQIMEMERTERAREVAGEVSGFFLLPLLHSLSFLGGGVFIFSFLSGRGIYVYILWFIFLVWEVLVANFILCSMWMFFWEGVSVAGFVWAGI